MGVQDDTLGGVQHSTPMGGSDSWSVGVQDDTLGGGVLCSLKGDPVVTPNRGVVHSR